MYLNISYKFHRILDTQSHFIKKVHDLLGQPSYMESSIIHYKGTHSEISKLVWLLNMAFITNSADSDELLHHFSVFTVCLCSITWKARDKQAL